MGSKALDMTNEQRDAIATWMNTLRTPSTARPAVVAKFAKLKLTPEQILADLENKLAIIRRDKS